MQGFVKSTLPVTSTSTKVSTDDTHLATTTDHQLEPSFRTFS